MDVRRVAALLRELADELDGGADATSAAQPANDVRAPARPRPRRLRAVPDLGATDSDVAAARAAARRRRFDV